MLLSRCLLLGALAVPVPPTSSTSRATAPTADAGATAPATAPSPTAPASTPSPAASAAERAAQAAASDALTRAASAPTPIGAVAGFSLVRPAAPASPSFPPPRDTVTAGLDAAEQLYREGRALEAIDHLHRLFLASGEPVCLANIGRLYDERAQPDLASEYYRKFLLHPRSAPEHRALIRARLLALTPEPTTTPPPLRQEGPTVAPPASIPTRRPRPDRLVAAGASLGGLTVLHVAAGAGLVAAAQARLSALDHAPLDVAAERERSVRDALTRRGAGVGLLVVGGVALVASLTTTALGLHRAERRRVRLAGLQLRF